MNAQERVHRAYADIAAVDRPEVWIALRPESDALADAAAVDTAVAAGAVLPLAGRVAAVKDNIDVAGLPTTAGCPSFGYLPATNAVVVTRLQAAGAVVIGKTNMDQFATGLAGTRSPYGAVRDARQPDRVSGGSSSGSAVAVALGLVDLALATDTAGSGRVPAAFQRIVGLKPSRGLLPLTGIVPADRQRDCVSVFAADLAAALELAAVLAGPDDRDPFSRTWPPDAPVGLRAAPRVGVAAPDQLEALTEDGLSAYLAAVKDLEGCGAELAEVDIRGLLEAGELLYSGSFVAARYTAFGSFLDAAGETGGVDETVRSVVSPAAGIPAHRLVADEERLASLQAYVARLFAGLDALVLPTTTRQPALEELAADPVGANAKLGTFTNFCNLLDLCAVAVPAGSADGGGFGVSFFGPAFSDAAVADVAALFLGTPAAGSAAFGAPGLRLAVFGAHLSGQPLNGQLAGGRLLGPVSTSADYRMFALAADPPKPGLVAAREGGGAVAGELWSLPADRLARLLAALPKPMALGPVELGDGWVTGFLCEASALDDAEEIPDAGGWRAYVARTVA